MRGKATTDSTPLERAATCTRLAVSHLIEANGFRRPQSEVANIARDLAGIASRLFVLSETEKEKLSTTRG